jgi:hypothetical protein
MPFMLPVRKLSVCCDRVKFLRRWLHSLLVVLLVGLLFTTQAQTWPDVFNPFRVLTLNLEVDPADWDALRHDTNTSFPEQVFRTSALMWADGETNKLLVQIRQGKDDPIPSFADPQKVGLKVDINDLVPGQEWRGLKKLSLENGNGGSGVLREAVAMNLHRLAAESGFYDYPNGYATWVRVVVNGSYMGLYAFPEQHDKQSLRNRGMYKPGATWLYEYNSVPILDTTVALTNSPTFDELCFEPFNNLCAQPATPSVALGMEATLEQLIDMRALLTLAAIESFIAYGDGLFTKGSKNVFATDFLPEMNQKRKYYVWDLDSGFADSSWDIYTGGPGQDANRKYQTEILAHDWFHDVYRHVYSDLLDGPLSTATLTEFVDRLEPVLTPYLAEDPHIAGGAAAFSSLREFFTNRVNNVRAQLGAMTGPPRFNQRGGEIIAGFQLVLDHTNSTGTIYYTLDGSDPRGLGGVVHGVPYTAPLTLTNTTHIISRVLSGTNWSALRQATFNVAGHAATIKVTEIMYSPLATSANEDEGDFEFIELMNTGTKAVNLSGCSFTGIGYTFVAGTVVQPGAFIVLVRHPIHFAQRYPGVPFHGVYWGGLSRFGEKIRLRNSDGNNILSVEYDDEPPWPQGANGFGHSLVNINLNGDPDKPGNWRESTAVHGSPGADDPPPPYAIGVVVNEVLAHTDPPLEDAIELHNTTLTAIDVGGWYLSDAMDLLDPTRASLKKYRIPGGTVIPAGGYKVFYEADFRPGTTNGDALVDFALSSLGEEVWLSTANAAGELTGHIVGFRFGASDNGVSIGRHLTSVATDFTFLDERTFGSDNPASEAEFRAGTGAANAIPRVGPILINELMYHPAEGGQEFVEFLNASQNPVDLGGWSLEGADYVFPPNTIVAPQGLLVLLATTNVSVTAFRSACQIPSDVPVLAHAFDLQNAGENVALSKPNDAPLDPSIQMDRVRYNDRSPWPTEADGEGPSLERISPIAYGNDPLNWRTAVYGGTPGRVGTLTNGIAIATNSSWRYFAEGGNLGHAWRSAAYADSGWPNSDGVLGAGAPFIDSILDFGPPAHPPVTTFFRKEFVINDDPASISRFQLEANYDDGFVAYINGHEVARRSMPAGPVEFNTLASPHPGGSYEAIDLMPHTDALVQGGNVLAVEVHQASVNDPDLAWDAQLTYRVTPGEQPIRITSIALGPGASLTIQWRSVPGATYYVEVAGDQSTWTDLSGPLQAGGTTSQYTHPVSDLNPMGFFRIRRSQ